jgi:hypothetical protein
MDREDVTFISGVQVSQLSDEPQLRDAIRTIGAIAQAMPNWDSYGAEVTDSVAVATAREVVMSLYRLVGVGGVPTDFLPLPNGGIQMEWKGAGGVLELEISPDSELHGLLVLGSRDERTFEDRRGLSVEELVSLLKRIL